MCKTLQRETGEQLSACSGNGLSLDRLDNLLGLAHVSFKIFLLCSRLGVSDETFAIFTVVSPASYSSFYSLGGEEDPIIFFHCETEQGNSGLPNRWLIFEKPQKKNKMGGFVDFSDKQVAISFGSHFLKKMENRKWLMHLYQILSFILSLISSWVVCASIYPGFSVRKSITMGCLCIPLATVLRVTVETHKCAILLL